MKKFKPMKIRNGKIQLPEAFLDALLLNDGDNLVLVEEQGRYYLRKTRETSYEEEEPPKRKTDPPKTFEELMREAQSQAGPGMTDPADLMDVLQKSLNDPETMNKIQNMAMGFFQSFMTQDPTKQGSEEEVEEEEEEDEDEDEDDLDGFDDDDDDDDEGVDVKIE